MRQLYHARLLRSDLDASATAPAKYGASIGKADVTGYCIKFKALKDINLDILIAAIQDGIEQSRGRLRPMDGNGETGPPQSDEPVDEGRAVLRCPAEIRATTGAQSRPEPWSDSYSDFRYSTRSERSAGDNCKLKCFR